MKIKHKSPTFRLIKFWAFFASNQISMSIGYAQINKAKHRALITYVYLPIFQYMFKTFDVMNDKLIVTLNRTLIDSFNLSQKC